MNFALAYAICSSCVYISNIYILQIRIKKKEPGKIYHLRNVIGRENLITCGRTNALAHAVWTEYSCDSFMADRMGLDGMLHYLAVRKATLPGSTESYGELTQTRTFENHANLLAYLAN